MRDSLMELLVQQGRKTLIHSEEKRMNPVIVVSGSMGVSWECSQVEQILNSRRTWPCEGRWGIQLKNTEAASMKAIRSLRFSFVAY